jgi:hypothetical protein
MWFFLSRGDHTSVDFYMAVVPPKTECVVFSIDGSFTASMSVTGRDPKVRAGAVDIVRWVTVLSGVFIAVYFGGTSCQFFMSFELLFSYHMPSNIIVISFIYYRVIHKSLQNFRTWPRNNQDRCSRKEHIKKQRISPSFLCTRCPGVLAGFTFRGQSWWNMAW